jgi:hypothetical protein
MCIQPSQYSHVHRGRCLPNCLSRNGRSCSKRLQPKQNPTNSFCASLYILYMSCGLQIMANLQKKYRTRVFISRKLTHMLLCVLIFTCSLVAIIYSMVVQATVNFRRILRCPRQYHVCVLLQWCILHGISVLLYVESSFCSAIINYHSSRPAFLPPKSPKNTCAREKNQSEQQKIRSLITENPPSRNRKPRFASALITIHRPPFSAPALMSLPATRASVRGRSRAAALCPYVLLSLCFPR